MLNAATLTTLSSIEAAVLECVVYGDLFDYPLTPSEVHQWLAVTASREDVDAALAGENLAAILTILSPYVTLKGREQTAIVRDRRRHSSSALREQAERYGRYIGRLPFVRMVAVTGSLAVDNAEAGDDLDYLVVTAPGRVWLSRAMIMAIGRFARLRGVTLCPNYVLADTALALSERSYYTARELLQMQLVAGPGVYARMLAANAWCRDYLPNARLPAAHTVPPELGSPERGRRVEGRETPVDRRSLPRRVAETVLGLAPFDALERSIYRRKGAELRRQAGSAEVTFDETMCKGHFDRWRERTQRRLQERLQRVLESPR